MEIGKYLIFTGFFLIFVGFIFLLSNKIPFLNFFGKMIGDFSYKTDNVSIYFPFMSMILLSIFLTLVVNILTRLFK